MLCGQYDILYASLKNLNQTSKTGQTDFKIEDQEINEYFLSIESHDTLDFEAVTTKVALRNCAKHHQTILEFAKLLENYFRWFLFPKLFYTGSYLTQRRV